MSKIPVYFMPGLAASSSIFDNIALPADKFEMFRLDWIRPDATENLKEYATRLTELVVHENPILIGVSFGGVVVQEMARIISVRKVVIISSAKCNAEFPLRMRIARYGGLYKLLPTSLVNKIQNFEKIPLAPVKVRKKLQLYERYMGLHDVAYLDWAIRELLLWDRSEPDPEVVHIHGDADEVFPVKYIKNYIAIAGGTHIMILNKYRWLNKNLPRILLESKKNIAV